MNTVADAPWAVDSNLHWNNRFAGLGAAFFTRQQAQPLPAPYWVGRSAAMARELGFDPQWFESEAALAAFTGNQALPGSDAMSTVYSGHQFGQWAGQLGDGRALLLGQLHTPNGQDLEIQLKGSGPTPYSRMGDGRAVLRSSIREFLCSEAMAGLGIATSRALCVTGSDAAVRRETLETAAVVTRVAPSFIRFGHFEHFSYSGQHEQLKALADYVIDHFYPACHAATAAGGNPYAALLATVCERTASMVAQWQAVGFCHGVMNTDNMSILGLTLDYGPFQFLDAYDPSHICNHSDNQGRYAYQNQPRVAYWNLFCLAQALLPLIGEPDAAMAALEPYKTQIAHELQARQRAKLGWADAQAQDSTLIETILNLLAQGRIDYSLFWRRLSQHAAGAPLEPVRDLFVDRTGFDAWAQQWAQRSAGQRPGAQGELMLRSNPQYILRNHLGEQAIRAAKLKDFSEVQRLLTVLERPFDEHPGMAAYADFPPDWASSIEISCSS